MVQMKRFLLLGALVGGSFGASSSTTSCNPISTSNCPADTALATDIAVDFTSKSLDFNIVSTESGVSYGDSGLNLTLAQRYDNPSLKSTFYIMFGRVEAHIMAASGTGIVSSFYLQSDDLDEIDIELLGGDTTQWQSNFFSKGSTTTYDRGEYHTISGGSPQTNYYNYTIDWTEEECVWYFNGTAVRTLKNTTSEGYPQTPMYIMMGIWAGGDSDNAAGTIEWAGGETDYSDAPFSMFINKLVVSDYSTGSEYSYSDTSGSWSSIEAEDGEVNGRIDNVDYDVSVSSSDDSSSSSFESSSQASSTSASMSSLSASSNGTESTSATSDSASASTSLAAALTVASDSSLASSSAAALKTSLDSALSSTSDSSLKSSLESSLESSLDSSLSSSLDSSLSSSLDSSLDSSLTSSLDSSLEASSSSSSLSSKTFDMPWLKWLIPFSMLYGVLLSF